MANSQLKKVFVYGTLKRGEPNHHWLTKKDNGYSNYLSNAVTTQKYPLVVGTRYNIPFLLNKPGDGNYVMGEIYEVDDQMMSKLDVLEDYPKFYDREIQKFDIGVGEGNVECWVYLLKNFPEKLLDLPHLAEYKNTTKKPYQERSQRITDVLAQDDLLYNSAIN
ncbi:unnamed protein product [Diamesa tonsa]